MWEAVVAAVAAVGLAVGGFRFPSVSVPLPAVAALHPASCNVPGGGHPYVKAWYAAARRQWAPERQAYWCLLPAQAGAESGFRPDAISPAGARGIAQFMDGTWHEARDALGVQSPFVVADAIRAQAWYMERMSRVWLSPRPEKERLELALASYNAGAGSLIRAQRLCRGARDWKVVKGCLPQVTGGSATETLAYVPRVLGRYADYTGGKW